MTKRRDWPNDQGSARFSRRALLDGLCKYTALNYGLQLAGVSLLGCDSASRKGHAPPGNNLAPTASAASASPESPAASVPATRPAAEIPSTIPTPFVKRVVRSPDNTYFTYPHSHGFLPDGRAVVARPLESGQEKVGDLEYLGFDLKTGSSSVLAQVKKARWYYSISDNSLMVVPKASAIVLVDLLKGTEVEISNEPGWSVNADIDISKDGKRILATMSNENVHRLAVFDVATRKMTPIFTGWATDHAHFSPFDQDWICFCDNRQPNHDRMWVWHAQEAPKARHVFDQMTSAKQWLEVGHERAMFNKRALLTVAYGGSQGSPRGLYEVDFDGKDRLVSEANSDLHCNVSHDGRWAVVTTEGVVADAKGDLDLRHRPVAGWQKTNGTYGESDVMIVNLKTGARRFLYRGHNDADGQPYEVQPSISPDDKWVLLKDAGERKVLALEMNETVLNAFLS